MLSKHLAQRARPRLSHVVITTKSAHGEQQRLCVRIKNGPTLNSSDLKRFFRCPFSSIAYRAFKNFSLLLKRFPWPPTSAEVAHVPESMIRLSASKIKQIQEGWALAFCIRALWLICHGSHIGQPQTRAYFIMVRGAEMEVGVLTLTGSV